MNFWQNKVVLVTGASRGIGKALADRLAEVGARLVLTARDETKLQCLAGRLSAAGIECVYMAADVRDQTAVEQVVYYGFDQLGKIDVLVNNAGIGLRGPVETLEPAQLLEAVAVNVVGPLHFIQATVPLFRRQGSGLVINIASLGAIQVAPNIGGYVATKAALTKLGETLQLELQDSGIRVCTAYPGSVRTEFRRHALGDAYGEKEPRLSRIAPEAVAEQILRQTAAGRRHIFITPKDRFFAHLAGVAPNWSEFLVGRAFRRAKGI